MGKIILILIIAAVGAYYYDLSSADTKIVKGKFSSWDTEHRCKNNHESMCKYYLTAKIGEGKQSRFYKFRVPKAYYHGEFRKKAKNETFPLKLKEKNIFPPRLIGLDDKYQAKIDKVLAQEIEGEGKGAQAGKGSDE